MLCEYLHARCMLFEERDSVGYFLFPPSPSLPPSLVPSFLLVVVSLSLTIRCSIREEKPFWSGDMGESKSPMLPMMA